ncbi:tRNA (cytidine(34)-2'-O)-methyltransferase [Bosea sp. PAMC 26642]|uniref:tRNA (cytidine(34)-2'-O)-methyltransferase n=1 Tax=Bosea sp. (strain PAMC 26642) TaxID=1792307 RepID=UPI0007704A25|nr:tRNA (cytidine(34)-2'-O)-methyltransferase [Bosea sp. PAMC 26642]AMJ60867.1 tRNA methyltransferase [Bosea sp. PAMC 26642]
MLRLALYQPDIPQNAGTMIRLCACLGIAVDIVEPAAFDVSDRHFRRSGMDYLERAAVTRHDGFGAFEDWRRAAGHRLIVAETDGATAHVDFAFQPGDIVMVGRESAGVLPEVYAAADATVHVPMRPGLRSLNVSVAAAIVLGEALRQMGGFRLPFDGEARGTPLL